MHVSSQSLSLSQILGDGKTSELADTSQLRSSKGKEGVYSNSYKSTGRFPALASAAAFVARFFSPSTKQSFREANTNLITLIQNEFGKEAAAAFKTEFASRLSWGSPLTAGSVRRFVAACKPTATNLSAVKTTYGEEMASTYQKAFLAHGEVRQGTTAEIRSTFEQLPPQDKTLTILSQEVRSLSEMGYHTDSDIAQFTDAVLPSGGFARISGESERSTLSDDFLYEPTNKRININSFLNTAKGNVQKAESYLSSVDTGTDLKAEAAASAKLTQAQEKLKMLEAATQGYETWPSDRLAAFVGMHKLLESVSDTEVLTEKKNLSSDLETLKSKTPDDLQQDHNEAIQNAAENLKTKEEVLQAAQGDPFLTEAQRDILKVAVTDATATLQKLKSKSPENLQAEHTEKISSKEKELSELTPRAERILEETKGCEKWEPARALAYVHQETAAEQEKSIKFDRICIKINGAVVPCVDAFKSYKENFGLFKAALEELAGKEIPDHQVTEMIELVNSERLSQGFASGADLRTGLTLGSAQALPHEKNIFNIKLTKEGSFDFHYDSGRSYLTSLQTPVEPSRFQRVSIMLNNQEIALNDSDSPEERTKFLRDRIPTDVSIPIEQLGKIMEQLEQLDPADPALTARAIQGLLTSFDLKLHLQIQPKPFVETPVISSSMTATTDMGLKLEAWTRDQAPPDLLQFETKKQFTYRYTPSSNTDDKGSVEILDSRQIGYPIPKRGTPFEEKQGDLSPALQKGFEAAFMDAFISQKVTPENITTLDPALFSKPLLGVMNNTAGPLRFDAMMEREGGLAASPKKTICTVTPTPQGTYKVSIALLDPDTFIPANGESNVQLKNSFVALDYEVELRADNKPRLTGPVHYQYHLEAAHAGVTLLSTGIQRQFANSLNDPKTRDDLTLVTNQPHAWESVEGEVDPSPISEQFYRDIERTDYFVPSEDGQLKPLYDRSTSTKDTVPLDPAQSESKKRAAIKEFSKFVGDDAKALAISKIANQQVSFAPLSELISTVNGPLQLENHGGGLPLGGVNFSYTFSKSPEGDVVIGIKIKQNPQKFIAENSNIDLDPKKSLVAFDYNLTCHFDGDGKLSITPGPINYTCRLEASASQEELATL